MHKVTISRMRERYAQTVLTFRITYVHRVLRVGMPKFTVLFFELFSVKKKD